MCGQVQGLDQHVPVFSVAPQLPECREPRLRVLEIGADHLEEAIDQVPLQRASCVVVAGRCGNPVESRMGLLRATCIIRF